MKESGWWRTPIRRYPDLVVHRALLRELGLSDEPLPEDLVEAAEHTSAREREAAQVEYAADEICLAWLLEAQLFELGGEHVFEGEIIGLIGSGLFVRFGEVFEGYLPARRLHGDYFELNPLGMALCGRRSRGALRLGDPIQPGTRGSPASETGSRRPRASRHFSAVALALDYSARCEWVPRPRPCDSYTRMQERRAALSCNSKEGGPACSLFS